MTATVVVAFALLESTTERFVTAHWRFAGEALEVSIVILAAAVFRPLHARIERLIEAAFTKRVRERSEALKHLQEELSSFGDTSHVLRRVIEAVDHHMGTAGSAMYLRRKQYEAEASSYDGALDSVDVDDALVIRLRSAHDAADPRLLGSRAAGELAFPMMAAGHLVGFLTLSPKRIEVEAEDRHALAALAEAAGHALVALDSGLRRHGKVRTNVPRSAGTFIGRDQEMRDLAALLDEFHLLTIVGAGGIGKTTLAARIGNDVLDRFPDGVWFVDLAPVADPVFIGSTALAAVGGREDLGRDPHDTLVSHLREKHVLLIFDNCEHLTNAVAQLIDSLLRNCAQLHVIATSRELLGIADERVFRLSTFGETEGVALFESRARAVQGSFALTPENSEIVARICARLDGIPLAIELAAARVKMMTVVELDRHLDDRFHLLTGGSRTALARHQTLQGLIEWSFHLLDDAEKATLRRLAVFAGRFTLDAAKAVVTFDPLEENDVDDLLGRLIDKSLVQFDSDKGRYALLESTKEFGRRHLDAAGETAPSQERHAEYFCVCAEAAWTAWRTPAWDALCAEVAATYAEYRAALQWALADRNDVVLGAALASALYRFWQERGRANETIWLERVLELGQDAAGMESWARTLIGLSSQYYAHGEFGRMEIMAQQAEAAYSALGDQDGLARTRNLLALACSYAGRYEQAEALYESATTMARETGDRWLEAALLNNYAALLVNWKGDIETAESLFTHSLQIARELANAYTVGVIVGDWSQAVACASDYERASALAREALDTFRPLGDRFRIAEQLIRYGHYRVWANDSLEARSALHEAIDVLRVAPHPREIVRCAEACADVALALSDFERAAMLWGFSDEWRTSKHLERPKPMRERLEASLASARAALGSRAFAAALESGRAFTSERALDVARTVCERSEACELEPTSQLSL